MLTLTDNLTTYLWHESRLYETRGFNKNKKQKHKPNKPKLVSSQKDQQARGPAITRQLNKAVVKMAKQNGAVIRRLSNITSVMPEQDLFELCDVITHWLGIMDI